MRRLAPGETAGEFEAVDQNGEALRLSDFRGKKLLLYFYPKAGTEGCTAQACQVRDARVDFSGLGVEVLGISPDCPADQKKFDDEHNLGFALVCDMDHVIAEEYGAWGEREMFGESFEGVIRSSFLLDEDGRVIEAWYDVKPAETVPLAKEALAELKE